MKASRAYAQARIRACRSRLLTRADAAPLFAATDEATLHRALVAAGIDPDALFQRLLRVYDTAIRAYRVPLLETMLRRYELENVRLMWRAIVRGHDRAVVRRLWKPVGTLRYIEASTVRELAEKLARTPFGEVAARVARAHGDDLAAAELAFDRWMSEELMSEAAKLPASEIVTKRLIRDLVAGRDHELISRAEAYGFSGRAESPPCVVHAGRALQPFLDPFLLAPAVATILLAEQEMRDVRACIERVRA